MNRKYEEITAPDVGDFCYITDNTYPKEEVIVFFLFFLLNCHFSFPCGSKFYCCAFINIGFIVIVKVVKMEADILKSLKFEMGNPTVKTFLR